LCEEGEYKEDVEGRLMNIADGEANNMKIIQ
jgi:hypothetical protein